MGGKARAHIYVSGRVQGVAFRYFAEKWARPLAVTGWVKNLGDGRVEVVAEGDRENLEAFVDRLRAGPRMARIDGFSVRWEEYTGEFPAFRVAFFGD